jgi:hypothetical protein
VTAALIAPSASTPAESASSARSTRTAGRPGAARYFLMPSESMIAPTRFSSSAMNFL